jgi:hypothetical protein
MKKNIKRTNKDSGLECLGAFFEGKGDIEWPNSMNTEISGCLRNIMWELAMDSDSTLTSFKVSCVDLGHGKRILTIEDLS